MIALAGPVPAIGAPPPTATTVSQTGVAYPCLIEPRQILKLAAPVAGVVASVEVDRGDHVEKGQLLAKLDSEVEEATAQIAQVHAANETAVQSGRARLEFLRRKQVRNDTLRTTDAVSVAQADEAASDARVAEAQVREAELNVAQARLEAKRALGQLQQRRVISPVTGVVTERALGPGEFRNDQAHILTIAEMDPLRVETFLPIAMFARVKPGDRATILPEAPVGGEHAATVTVVDRVFDAASGTVGVRLEMPNPGGRLPAGVHCSVRFTN